MKTNEKKIDVYPWAVPTDEQKSMFDALSYEKQLEMVRNALIEGEQSGISERTVEEIPTEVTDRLKREGEL